MWHASLSARGPNGKPLLVLRWSNTRWRQLEAIRDRIMFGCGTDEPWFYDEEFYGDRWATAITAHWRKPLRIEEINQMAETPDVRWREGRT